MSTFEKICNNINDIPYANFHTVSVSMKGKRSNLLYGILTDFLIKGPDELFFQI